MENSTTYSCARFIAVICGAALFFCGYAFADAATLSLYPSTGVYTAGQTFSASVVVNTSGAAINAADGTLTFNPNEITVLGVSKGSIFGLWTADPSFSNAQGTIDFSGGSPSGYTGGSGTVLSITFRANAAGSPKVNFTKGSVLAADGRGTNVLTAMNGAAFTITAKDTTPAPEKVEYVAPANTPAAPSITSTSHPDQALWYTATTAALAWKLPSGITGVRTLFDEKPGTIPTKVYDSPISNISLPDIADGIHYFHIQFKNENGWGKVADYRIAVDTQKPTSFTITLPDGADLSNPVQTLLLKADDATSKVREYSIQLDGKDPYAYDDKAGSSTVTLPALQPGHHTVIIEAFDEAHNSIISTFSFDILAFNKPRFTEYPSSINEQVIPVIKGVTKPNSKVTIVVKNIGLAISSENAVKNYTVDSQANGEFVFIPDGRFALGVYELTATAIDQYGAQSEASDPIRIAVEEPGYLRLGSLVVSALSILVPLIALLILAVLGVWFMLARLRHLRKGIFKEAKEADSVLIAQFEKIEQELRSQQQTLKTSRKTGKLTKAEETLFAALSQTITDARKRVEKEILDVEDLVD